MIFSSLVTKLLMNDSKGAANLLANAGRSALLGAVGGGPLATLLGGALDSIIESGGVATTARRTAAATGVTRRTAGQQLKAKISHERWMRENSWRFDWRSQPRRPAGTEAGGEWMEGRLPYPVAVKYSLSRRERQRRTKAIKEYKARQIAMGKTRTRTIRTSWGEF